MSDCAAAGCWGATRISQATERQFGRHCCALQGTVPADVERESEHDERHGHAQAVASRPAQRPLKGSSDRCRSRERSAFMRQVRVRRRQGSGSIVNIASVDSFFQPDPATVDYGVAKAPVVNLSKSLSQEFGPKGIRVNCVSPEQVSTDLWLGEHSGILLLGRGGLLPVE
jgi:NAD(P)-dependent dehydrogenase (short-subunit alcohol dehydrogenase family)